MTTKQDAYNTLFKTAWDTCMAGGSVSIRLASSAELPTFRTYLSRWKTLKKVEHPEMLAFLAAFRPALRQDDTGLLMDFYSLQTPLVNAKIIGDAPPPPPPPPVEDTMPTPTKGGVIHPAVAADLGVDMAQMARRKDWVRVLNMRGWQLQEALGNEDFAATWLHHGPESADGVGLLETFFPHRSEASDA